MKSTLPQGEQKDAGITAFPNPATGEVRVTIPNDWQHQQVTYSIYNVNGGIIKNKISAQGVSNIKHLNIADLKAGTYFIKVSSGSN